MSRLSDLLVRDESHEFNTHPDCTCGNRRLPHERYCPLSTPEWVRRSRANMAQRGRVAEKGLDRS